MNQYDMPEPYADGYEAWLDGRSMRRNPYLAAHDRMLWREGWRMAHMEASLDVDALLAELAE